MYLNIYIMDATTYKTRTRAWRCGSDVDFAPPGSYGVIFEPETGEIIDREPVHND